MPTGPKGQKRPADVIFAAVKVMRIATGQEGEMAAAGAPKSHGPAKGGAARAKSHSVGKRREIAQKAAKARWRASPVPFEEE